MRCIRKATIQDIPGILPVLQENLITNFDNPNTEQLQQNGFLLHGFTCEELEQTLADTNNNFIVVSVEHNQVIGYALEYDLQQAKPSWLPLLQKAFTIPNKMKEFLLNNKILYHKHIAKSYPGKGVGKDLLGAVVNEAKHRKYQYIICQIVLEPVANKISIQFHEKQGFESIGNLKEGEVTLGLYLKVIK